MGIEVEINKAALKWMGVTKIQYEVMPYGQLISALLAKRIDVDYAIHITPERKKVAILHRTYLLVRTCNNCQKGYNANF